MRALAAELVSAIAGGRGTIVLQLSPCFTDDVLHQGCHAKKVSIIFAIGLVTQKNFL